MITITIIIKQVGKDIGVEFISDKKDMTKQEKAFAAIVYGALQAAQEVMVEASGNRATTVEGNLGKIPDDILEQTFEAHRKKFPEDER